MPNQREPTAFTDADVFVKPRSDLRTQMDNSIARHLDRVTNTTTRNRLAFRFTIRDLLWLTVVLLMAIAWWCHDYSRTAQEMRRSNESLETAKQAVRELRRTWEDARAKGLKLPDLPDRAYDHKYD